MSTFLKFVCPAIQRSPGWQQPQQSLAAQLTSTVTHNSYGLHRQKRYQLGYAYECSDRCHLSSIAFIPSPSPTLGKGRKTRKTLIVSWCREGFILHELLRLTDVKQGVLAISVSYCGGCVTLVSGRSMECPAKDGIHGKSVMPDSYPSCASKVVSCPLG